MRLGSSNLSVLIDVISAAQGTNYLVDEFQDITTLRYLSTTSKYHSTVLNFQ